MGNEVILGIGAIAALFLFRTTPGGGGGGQTEENGAAIQAEANRNFLAGFGVGTTGFHSIDPAQLSSDEDIGVAPAAAVIAPIARIFQALPPSGPIVQSEADATVGPDNVAARLAIQAEANRNFVAGFIAPPQPLPSQLIRGIQARRAAIQREQNKNFVAGFF